MKMNVYYWKDIKWLTKTSYSDKIEDCKYPTKKEFKRYYKKIPISFSYNDKIGNEVNFDRVFSKLNQEYNPLGTSKMQEWIKKNLRPHPHTSMSVGDIINVGNKYWIATGIGWHKLNWG